MVPSKFVSLARLACKSYLLNSFQLLQNTWYFSTKNAMSFLLKRNSLLLLKNPTFVVGSALSSSDVYDSE